MSVAKSLDPLPDRRGALRHPVVVPALLSTGPGDAISVTIINISEGGCQLARNLEIEAGSAIGLSFGGYASVEAAVIWTSPTAFGLRFEAALHPALVAQVVSAGKGRRARRLTSGLVRREEREKLWHLALPVSFTFGTELTGPAHPHVGELRDLSVEGCRINTPAAIPPGSKISLLLAGPEAVFGSVRWSENESIGVHFCEPLPSTLVKRIAGRAWKSSSEGRLFRSRV